MKKFFLSIAAAFLAAIPSFASKANSTPFTVVQSDGTLLTVVLNGDEHFSWYSTTDGVVLAHDKGTFYVADLRSDGTIASAGIVAHNPDSRSVAERAAAKAQTMELFGKVAKTRRSRALNASRVSSRYFPHTGSPTVLVILAEFADNTFSLTDPKASFEQYFNGGEQVDMGHGEARNYGSVKTYFTDMSGGQYTPNFKVVGPVKLSKPLDYYGKDDESSGGKDVNFAEFLTESCQLASGITDFSDSELDSNADGDIDLVAVIFAGFGQNNNANSNTIWAKTSIREVGTFAGKNVRLNMAISELNANEKQLANDGSFSTPQINGVGVFCHEMTHALGFPDLYPTAGAAQTADNQGMEYWSLMDGGENLNFGYTPTAYTAFERGEMGWSTTENVADDTRYTLKSFDQGGTAYRYDKPGDLGGKAVDYMLMENIQNTGWNTRLPSHGLIVYRISLNTPSLSFSSPLNNVSGDPGVTIVPADGLLQNSNNCESSKEYVKEMSGDLFPGKNGVTTLTAAQCLPNFSWRKAPVANGCGLLDIAEDSSTGEVSFRFVADAVASGISTPVTVAPDSADGVIYSIDGRLLGTDTSLLPKGIYIKNGKKFVK